MPKKRVVKYIFNPERSTEKVVISSKGWVITSDNFTQEQAAYVMHVGSWGDLFIPEPKKAKK